MKKRTKKQLKRRLLIGLVVTMLGYLCMQDALFVQDAVEPAGESYRTDEEFGKILVKKFTDEGILTLKNASESGLSLTEEQKTKWNEIATTINDLADKAMAELEKQKEIAMKQTELATKIREMRDKFRENQNKGLAKEKEEIQDKISALKQQIEATQTALVETLGKNPNTLKGVLDPLKQKILDLEAQIPPLKEEELELSSKMIKAELDFYKTEEYKKFLNDRNEILFQLGKKQGEVTKLGKEYFDKAQNLLIQLYEIYKETKGGK